MKRNEKKHIKVEADVITQVNTKTKEVELVEVRNSTYGLIWSYYD